MGLTPVDFFVRARVAPIDLAVLVAVVGWYAWSIRRLTRAGRSWPPVRLACFAAGCAVFAAAACSGLTAFAPSNFSAFGAQYVMAGMVAPALLAFSAPLSLAGTRVHYRSARLLAGPITTWIVFSASVFLVFESGVRGWVLGGGLAQQAVLVWLLAAGWLFYWPVVDADPLPQRLGYWPRILYLLLTFPVFAIMGMGLESANSRVSPALSLASLHLGAAVTWVAGETLGLIGAVAVFVQWLRADERKARSHDLGSEQAAARQLALWRASREAAARAASTQ